jgi:class 3 adenylate cyclase
MTLDGLESADARNGTGPLVDALNEWAESLEEKADRAEMERVSCFGGRYIFGCGLAKRQIAHVRRSVDFALEALKAFTEINQKAGLGLTLKIGIQTGSVTTAVVGQKMFHYDVWGDAMDGAAKFSEQANADTIRVGEAVNEKVRDVFAFEPVTPRDGSPAAWVLTTPKNA